jgi:hypothetical protein
LTGKFQQLYKDASQLLVKLEPIYTADMAEAWNRRNQAHLEGETRGAGNPLLADGDSDSEDDELCLRDLVQKNNVVRGREEEEGEGEDEGEDEEEQLAAKRSRKRVVWDNKEDDVRVALMKPLKKSPATSSAKTYHQTSTNSSFKFYTEMEVTDDLGQTFAFDLTKPNELAFVFYDLNDEGQKVIACADILAIYTLEDSGQPFIEHGYYYDAEDVEEADRCNVYLAKNPPLEEREVLDSSGVFHTPADQIEGKAFLYASKADLPDQGQPLHDLSYFCSRGWDMETFQSLDRTNIYKSKLRK